MVRRLVHSHPSFEFAKTFRQPVSHQSRKGMSSFKVILVVLLIAVGLVKIFRRKKEGASGAVEVDPDSVDHCPHCEAEIEPEFLECWNCGGKLKLSTDGAPSAELPTIAGRVLRNSERRQVKSREALAPVSGRSGQLPVTSQFSDPGVQNPKSGS
jgi:hypothetical protein